MIVHLLSIFTKQNFYQCKAPAYYPEYRSFWDLLWASMINSLWGALAITRGHFVHIICRIFQLFYIFYLSKSCMHHGNICRKLMVSNLQVANLYKIGQVINFRLSICRLSILDYQLSTHQ